MTRRQGRRSECVLDRAETDHAEAAHHRHIPIVINSDAHAPEDQIEAMMAAVEDVLEEIGAGEVPRLLALNKADLLDEEMRARAWSGRRDALLVSAVSGEGLDELRERVDAQFAPPVSRATARRQ